MMSGRVPSVPIISTFLWLGAGPDAAPVSGAAYASAVSDGETTARKSAQTPIRVQIFINVLAVGIAVDFGELPLWMILDYNPAKKNRVRGGKRRCFWR